MTTLLLDFVEKVQRRYLESNFFAIALLKVTFSIESKFIKVVYGPSYIIWALGGNTKWSSKLAILGGGCVWGNQVLIANFAKENTALFYVLVRMHIRPTCPP